MFLVVTQWLGLQLFFDFKIVHGIPITKLQESLIQNKVVAECLELVQQCL